MFNNLPQNIEYCGNIVSSLSQLLYYSHIPLASLGLVGSFFVYIKNKNLRLAQLLLAINVSFAIWAGLDLVIWLSYANSHVLMFAWSIIEIFSVLLFILSYSFLYVFIYKKDLALKYQALIFIVFFPVIALSFSSFNLISFNGPECIANEFSRLSDYIFGLKIFFSLLMIGTVVKSFYGADRMLRKQLALLSVGIFSFLFSFLISGFIAGITEVYVIEIYGVVAMLVFIVALSKLVVDYGVFNMKVFGSQLLVFALNALIAAQFSFIRTPINRMLNAMTLVLSVFFGWILIKSVRREVKQREKIEKLAKDLESSNEKLKELDQLKSEFLSLATHQIRSPLTAIKGYSSMLLEGDYGVLAKPVNDTINVIYKSSQNLIDIVADFLDISRIDQGRMHYEKESFDMRDIVMEVVVQYKPNIEKANLTLNIKETKEICIVKADKGKMKQIVGNILDNAIKYTPKGSIDVSVSADDVQDIIKVSIKDSGIGIPKNEIDRLFGKFSRAKEANRTNVMGTGLGLYIAKKMIEAQGGAIVVSSDGAGRGTTFTIEFPKLPLS